MFRVVWKYLRVAIGKNASFNVMNVIVAIMLLLGQNNFWQFWRPFSHYNVIAIKSKMQSKSPPYRCLDATVMNVFIAYWLTVHIEHLFQYENSDKLVDIFCRRKNTSTR